MKRTDLMSKIGKASRRLKTEWVFVRPGGKHDLWSCGLVEVAIPRHREINEVTAEGIMKDLESGVRRELVATVAKKRIYTAHCVRSGGWWAVSVPEIRGVHTQARRLDRVEEIVKDAIALVLDIPEDSFEVRVEADLPETIQLEVAKAQDLRVQLERLQLAAQDALWRVIVDLATEKMTFRDVGELVGLSHQRVAQVMAEAKASGYTATTKLGQPAKGRINFRPASPSATSRKRRSLTMESA